MRYSRFGVFIVLASFTGGCGWVSDDEKNGNDPAVAKNGADPAVANTGGSVPAWRGTILEIRKETGGTIGTLDIKGTDDQKVHFIVTNKTKLVKLVDKTATPCKFKDLKKDAKVAVDFKELWPESGAQLRLPQTATATELGSYLYADAKAVWIIEKPEKEEKKAPDALK